MENSRTVAQAYPEVDLALTTGTSCGLVADVINHNLDGAFVAEPVHNADLIEEAIICEELMVVTPPNMHVS